MGSGRRAFVTRVMSKTRTSPGSAAFSVATVSSKFSPEDGAAPGHSAGTNIRSPTTCPAAWTPLSVRPQRVHCTLSRPPPPATELRREMHPA